jgi:plastocyanin
MSPYLTLGAPNVSAVDTRSRVAASRVTWRTLVVAAAIGNLAMLAWLVVSAQDTLALSLVAVLVVGLALSRVRDGLAGRVVLGLAFADMSWYTVSGAIWNLVNREGIAAVVIPAWLGSLAVAGLVAAVASILNRSTPDAGRTGAPRVGAVAVTCFALALAVNAVQGRADKATASQPNTVGLTTENMAYSSKNLTAETGQITLRLNNHDLFWHTFTIDSLAADLKVAVDGDESVTFNATPGTYEFYCTVPGHAQMGMRGTLVVR